jgi:hypothetical protein
MKERIYYAIEYFVESPIEIASQNDEEIFFVTESGESGKIEKNYKGDWSVYLEEEMIYEIESGFFNSIFSDISSDPSEYYKSLKLLEGIYLKPKTQAFLESLIVSTEYLLLFAPAVIPKTPVGVGPFFIYNLMGKKIINILN